MTCKCAEKLTSKLREAGYDEANLGNTSFSIEDGLRKILTIPFYYKKINPNTDKYYQKKYEIPVEASYCPFCGQPTK